MNGLDALKGVLGATGAATSSTVSHMGHIEDLSPSEGSLDDFIKKFGGYTEPYYFYNGEVELRYDSKEHVYLLVSGEDLIPQPGVSTVSHIIDKSEVLLPWACKMMAQKLERTLPFTTLPTGEKILHIGYLDLLKIITEAKSAHKDKLEEAGDIGTAAHNWIEKYINLLLKGSSTACNILLPEDERAKSCIKAALDWMDKHNVRWKCTERKVYSRAHQFAGTMDGLALVDSCSDPFCCPIAFSDRLSIIDWKSSNYLYMEFLLQTAAYQLAYIEETNEPVEDRWIIRLGKTDGKFEAWHCDLEEFEEDVDAFLSALILYKSSDQVGTRMKEKSKALKEGRREKKQQDKEENLKLKCKNADKYKGIRVPTCNDGQPCQTCMRKWIENQMEKK